ncbi:hypothetical protein NSPZN2_10980 [Nitrospira defluvii]|uniref:Transposase n=1 Tax=Nitrospira defluvii TaxID=330214 RepID=A0ABM8QN04_9BACT|nr:hypothetical protein NSPZN2_10980 [Nitrospira defluvii]
MTVGLRWSVVTKSPRYVQRKAGGARDYSAAIFALNQVNLTFPSIPIVSNSCHGLHVRPVLC